MPLGLGGGSELKIVLSLKDKASAKLKTFNKDFKSMAAGIAKGAAVAGAAMAVGIGVKAVKSAADFEKSMANVATLVDTNVESMSEMGKKVKEISKKMPVDIGDLTTALYNVRSAGIGAGKAMDVLESSGRLAVAGLGTTEEAVNLLTSSINVFEKQGYTSDEMANILFKTVKAGKTTVAELAQSFGMVAPIAGALNVSFPELQAATAALTTTGMKASVAQSQLKATMANLIKPTKEMKELMDKVGVSTGEQLIETYGLVGGLEKLRDASAGNTEQFAKAMGSIEGLNAAMFLTGEGADSFGSILDDTTNKTDLLTEGFEKQKATTAAQFQMLKNNLNVTLINLGTKILPIVIKAVNWLTDYIGKMGEGVEAVKWYWDQWIDTLAKFIIKIENAIQKVKDFVEAAKRIPSKVGGFFTGVGEKVSGFLGFQHGGVVPGVIGAPVPAIVHGGETIIPAGKAGGVTINITGNTFMADEEQAERIGDLIIERLKTQMRFMT